MKFYHHEVRQSVGGYRVETTDRTGLVLICLLGCILLVAAFVFLCFYFDAGIKRGVGSLLEALENIGRGILITIGVIVGVVLVLGAAVNVYDLVKNIRSAARARAESRARAEAEAEARARARIEAERQRLAAARAEVRRRIEAYQRVISLLAQFRWEEAITILEGLPLRYRNVTSLLAMAKRGAYLDGLCAQADFLAIRGKWLKAEVVLNQVPDDWQGRFSAAALKKSIRERAAQAKAEAVTRALGGPTYYEVLEVSWEADEEEIKKAFRRLAREFHPDVSHEPQAEERFKRINEAHEVLSDSEKRAKYDQMLNLLARAEQFRRGD